MKKLQESIADLFEGKPRPQYTSPPVVETVLGYQFDPITRFTNPHLGAFWASLGSKNWPHAGHANEIPESFERFDEGIIWDFPSAKLTLHKQAPVGRIQIKNREQDQMIQAQRNRFHFNWIGHEGQRYPNYEVVRRHFDDLFTVFRDYVKREELGAIKLNQWEATYVNHLERGGVWQSPEDWCAVFPSLVPNNTSEEYISLENIDLKYNFNLPKKLGRLHIHLQHAQKSSGDNDLLVLRLTARGPMGGESKEDGTTITELGLAREVIVRAFCALSSDMANGHWGLET